MDAERKGKSMKLSMPIPESSGFIVTLNKMGYMTSSLDPYSTKIVGFSSVAPGPFLDIGAAYGVASLAALEKGSKVIANDLDSRHLEILQERAPEKYKRNLTLVTGSFPDEINFSSNSLGSILICRVLHFFDGPTIIKGIKKTYDWLSPGGKLAIVTETPYLGNFRNFIPIYERRVSEGCEWPGFIDDVMAIAPDRGKNLPSQIHFLDPIILSRIVKQCGFIVESADFFSRPEFPRDLQLDGRESVGIIAIKKKD